MDDRIALVGLLWFVGFTFAGEAVGRLFETPGTGATFGFLFALVSLLSWPFVMPGVVQRWMHDSDA
jgi:hypothetical protein